MANQQEKVKEVLRLIAEIEGDKTASQKDTLYALQTIEGDLNDRVYELKEVMYGDCDHAVLSKIEVARYREGRRAANRVQ